MANEHALASAGEPQCEMPLAALVLERAVTRNVLGCAGEALDLDRAAHAMRAGHGADAHPLDRKSTRLNSSHLVISYAVFCLKKKNKQYSAGILRYLILDCHQYSKDILHRV